MNLESFTDKWYWKWDDFMQMLLLTFQLHTVCIDAVHSQISFILNTSVVLTCKTALSSINLIIFNRLSESAPKNEDESLTIQSLGKPRSRPSWGQIRGQWRTRDLRVLVHQQTLWCCLVELNQVLKSEFELFNKVWVSSWHFENFVDVELSRIKSVVEDLFRPKIKTKM